MNTQAKINALCGDRVGFDIAAGVATIDENQGDAVGNACLIIGGDPAAMTVKFLMQTTQNAVNGA